jgi:hypothetical protein
MIKDENGKDTGIDEYVQESLDRTRQFLANPTAVFNNPDVAFATVVLGKQVGKEVKEGLNLSPEEMRLVAKVLMFAAGTGGGMEQTLKNFTATTFMNVLSIAGEMLDTEASLSELDFES